MSTVFLIFIAFVAGLAITLQGQFMGLMDRALGTKESIFITYIDHYGFFGAAVRSMDLSRLLGLSLMLIGVWLVVR